MERITERESSRSRALAVVASGAFSLSGFLTVALLGWPRKTVLRTFELRVAL